MKKQAAMLAGILAVLLTLQASSGKPKGTGDLSARPVVRAQAPRLAADFGKIPLHFIPNEGQVEGPAAFYVQGKDKTIYFAPEGLTFVLGGPREPARESWVVKLDFVGADPKAVPESLEESGAVISYFSGKPKDWQAGLKASSRIAYRELWPGIDLVYYGTVDRLKYEFLVRPGADPSRIKLAYRGARSVRLTEEGRLAVETPAGGFEDDVPAAWQEDGVTRVAVDMAYVLDVPAEDMPPGDSAGPNPPTHVFGFDVGEYDRSLPLVLDPAVLVYCGFIGGANDDGGEGIAVDNAGNAYVSGYTRSVEPTFPVVVGPDLTFNAGPGNGDIFVAKVNPEGSGLVYCGYIGGEGFEGGWDIAVDDLGNAYITGEVGSTEDSFPVLGGPDLTFNGAIFDAFVVKVNAAGTSLGYCGYIGGENDDGGYGIAVDGSGNAYITGSTISNRTFPAVVGPALPGLGWDPFVAKVNPEGAFVYCGLVGGEEGGERGAAIAVDRLRNAYITGETNSIHFPVKGGPFLTSNGGFNAFVAKVNAAGTALVYCGYIGGPAEDYGYGIAVDDSGNAYVTGETQSTEATFPVKAGPDLTYNGGYFDAFVAKVNAAGTKLDYCGYIGSSNWDRGMAVAVAGSGHAYVTGISGADFPVVEGPGETYSGLSEAFVVKMNAVGTAFVYSGRVGGSGGDFGVDIAVDGPGNAYIVGNTSPDIENTFPALVGPDLTYNGYDFDAFIAKISPFDVSDPVVTSLAPSNAAMGDGAFMISVHGTDFADGTVVRWNGNDRTTIFLTEQELTAEIGAADLGTVGIVAVTVRNPDGGVSNVMEFSVNNPVPSLDSLSPVKATAGGTWFAMTLRGSNFVPQSTALWEGDPKTTVYVSGTELRADILMGDIAAAGEFHVTVTNPAPGGGSSNAVSFPVAGFAVGATPAGVTVTAGQSATYAVEVTPRFGTFDPAVSLSCEGLPKGCTASFSPASVTPGAGPASSTLTLKTTARTGAAAGGTAAASSPIPPALAFLSFLPVAGLCFGCKSLLRSRSLRFRLAAMTLACLIGLLAGCSAGGGNEPAGYGTPAGTHQITLVGKSGFLRVTSTITITVR